MSFSWNDSLIFINSAESSESYNPRLVYYSFKDSTLYYENISIYPQYSITWHKDNDKLIYNDEDNILTYSILNNKFDTLVSTENYDKIVSFSYHPSNNILAYSLEENSYYDTNYVYSLNLSDSSKNMLFKAYYTPGSCGDCHSGPITQMVWNIEGNLLSFTSEPYLNPSVVNIYLYNHDIDTTFQFAKYNEGFTYQLQWLDKRRIAYENATYGHKLMGYQYDKPLPVKETLNDDYTINLSCYPNPFNPTTNVEFSVLNNSNVNISIYNILGEKIKTLLDERKSEGTYNIQWNAKDNNNKTVATGVYFIKLTTKNISLFTKSKYLKIIKLK